MALYSHPAGTATVNIFMLYTCMWRCSLHINPIEMQFLIQNWSMLHVNKLFHVITSPRGTLLVSKYLFGDENKVKTPTHTL